MTIEVENRDLLRCGSLLPEDSTKVHDLLVLVEVLSPDSGSRDRATKLRAYFKLPSVRHYLIVWPDHQRIVCHSRTSDDQVATEVHGSGDIRLEPPGITVSVEEFYLD